MNREWTEEFNDQSNPYEDPNMSKKDKLVRGYYSMPFVSRYFSKRMKILERDLEFLQKVIQKNTKKSNAEINLPEEVNIQCPLL